MKLYEKYPCGYEFKLEIGIFQSVGLHWDNEDGCPIHGKKCKKGGNK